MCVYVCVSFTLNEMSHYCFNISIPHFLQQRFANIFKVYASNGEPCCASCITPVFNEMWSASSQPPPLPPNHPSSLPQNSASANSLAPSTDSGVIASDGASTGGSSVTLVHRDDVSELYAHFYCGRGH